MPALRTLPQALRDAAAGGHGSLFIGGASRGLHDAVYRSYAELHAAALAVSGSFRRQGLRRGDLVGLAIDDAEAFLTALYGASIAGLLPASLHPPGSTRDPDSYCTLTLGVLRAAGARALVTSPGLAGRFSRDRTACPQLDVVIGHDRLAGEAPGPPEAGGASASADEPGLDDLALVQFTSGATSQPKGVALTHRNLCENVNAINGPHGLATTDADSAVSWLPLHHDMGLVGMALGPLYASRPAVFLPAHAFVRRPVEWLRTISRHRATVSFAPTFAYDLCVRRVRDSDLDTMDLSSWRVAGCGAEPIHAPTLAAFAERFRGVGFRESSFLPGYGLAEHVVAATFAPRERPLRIDGGFVSCGVPLPGHRLRIAGEDGADLPERDVGEILLGGPSLMQGYFERGAVVRDSIADGWLHTGDLGFLADGELYVCGRLKDLIIVNGRNVYPQDIERGVEGLAGLRRNRAVAFGTADAQGRDRLVMVVEPNGAMEAAQIAAGVRRRVADLCGLVVDEVVVVPGGTVGHTSSGKVQRALVRARYERGELR